MKTIIHLLISGAIIASGSGCHSNNMEHKDTVMGAAQAPKHTGGTASDDEAAIRALEDRFTAAFNAGDIDAMMKNYIPDKSLVVFDVVPRKQYLGADAYREDWVDFFSHFRETPKITITDLGITVDGNIGFSHSFQHVMGIDKQGNSINRTVRVTDGYRKIGGNWLIVLEHVSVPVNMKTGKADLTNE
ncbi:nuclear transport factor 2 family protein [Flavitalea sp. BT771]|uniref:YybH family protein n=1 Tax=Flavitalea sp. BT771 TaxID=3063329 RepID=UPI0026E456BC|nr:nuclear transport factor 2 family protein [Flavitalea sp. BT771]MDO6430362.1 nuclear transport factor 2 family protein [Flavitalea sp. BT771]MDV6219498.1 nuclear transport factor 2 family protein [Flavitalea sp. BT771]